MGDSLDDAVDLVELILWMIAGIGSIAFCASVVMTNLQPYTLPDKTAIVSESSNDVEPYQWTVRDYLLMLMVADEYCPPPQVVDLKLGPSAQDTRLVLDHDYVINKAGRLQKYYINFLSARVDDPITSYDYYYEDEDGDGGRWRFTVDR